ncbi:hypothetical protein CVB87_24060, partial [Salmonella enterica subsp. enterica serovar Enteritidis]
MEPKSKSNSEAAWRFITLRRKPAAGRAANRPGPRPTTSSAKASMPATWMKSCTPNPGTCR